MRRGGPLVAVLAVVFAAIVGVGVWLGEEGARTGLVLAEIDGAVTVTGSGARGAAGVAGRSLDPLDRIVTGEGARAVLELGGETRIRLGPVSTVQIIAIDEEGVEIELEEGALQATVRPDAGAVRLASRGRRALVTDGEVAMAVLPDEVLIFEATRGDVMLGGIVGASVLEEGSRLVVGEADHVEIGAIPADMLLAVQWPENPRTRQGTMEVSGRTEPGARVRVEGSAGVVEIRADDRGAFKVEIPLYEGENPVKVEAIGLLGRRVEVTGLVERDQSGPLFRGDVEYPR